jgi:methyl-accepting chemotaxis protein
MKIKHTFLLGAAGLALLPLAAALLWHIATDASAQGIEPPAQAQLRAQVVQGAAAITAALLLGVGLLTAGFMRRVVRPLSRLRDTVNAVADSPSDIRSHLSGSDEISRLGRALDRLLDGRIATLERAAQQNERLNSDLITLLQTVFQLANRDLTARADVRDDVIGTLASSINDVADAAGSTLAQVRDIAGQVREATAVAREQAEQVGNTAQQDRQTLQRMSDELTRATRQLMKVARLSENSGQTATRAVHATDNALLAVAATVRGMGELRESMTDTEQRFKRLGERSQTIATAVGLIGTIAERTHILAMNASIQAATTGEAGRRIGVMAEEVQRLAENSRQASGEIAQLVQNIQVETQESLYTLSRLIGQVAAQSEQARQAGDQMTLTRQNAAELIEALRKMAVASDQQSLVARELQLSVTRLHKGSDRTVAAIDAQTRSTQTLADCSQRLTEAVGPFKLPQNA